MLIKRFSFLCLVSVVTGCATMNESECLTADWRGIGYEDGAQGRTSAMLTKRREACAKHGVTPVLKEYQLGYREGLTVFCTEHNGFTVGSSGYQYSGICPKSLEKPFMRGYTMGKQLSALEEAVFAIQSRIDNASHDIDHLQSDIAIKREVIISDDSTRQQRAVLLDQIQAMEYEIGVLEGAIVADLQELAIAEQDLTFFREQIPY
ncbi:DUF2799 domain-containing protein [Marinibactrum halimedae]|uniref:DUF2799 domain-containing protein n=1 Tax=Marinibactrum halimedae TaxID=1444977 RepID=A0AA37T9A4_9GAMM|nr:DUF2799 domain-containing protein [Marinibactrum halimedae]MCD9458129.1 DUF2799 domain-containing protein [Marinibactrum halimedae]GLS25062.1 hypothetical protein GCM10007877_07760 [Marinibactrum halimedae]